MSLHREGTRTTLEGSHKGGPKAQGPRTTKGRGHTRTARQGAALGACLSMQAYASEMARLNTVLDRT